MEDAAQPADASARDTQGRWMSGHSGNPKGKKPGTKNRFAQLVGKMMEALENEEEALELMRDMIDLAHGRDRRALVFCLERFFPRPGKRPLPLQIFEGHEEDDVEILDAARFGLATGELTPDEANSVARYIAFRRQIVEAIQGGGQGPAGPAGPAGPGGGSGEAPAAGAAPVGVGAPAHVQTPCKSTSGAEVERKGDDIS
jgi:hypothetical protein